jgi:hypothetical protein
VWFGAYWIRFGNQTSTVMDGGMKNGGGVEFGAEQRCNNMYDINK